MATYELFPSLLPDDDSADADAPFYCGVNDCRRKVDQPSDTCWQH